MKIIFSDHATQQLKERKITRKLVLGVLKNPEKTIKSYKNRQLLQRQFGDRILEVVMAEEEDNLVVITQYFLERE